MERVHWREIENMKRGICMDVCKIMNAYDSMEGNGNLHQPMAYSNFSKLNNSV